MLPNPSINGIPQKIVETPSNKQLLRCHRAYSLAFIWDLGVVYVLYLLQLREYILANLKDFFAGQNPTFCRTFLDTPGLFKTYLKNHWPYTSNTPFYIKMQDTNFVGHLAVFTGEQDI